jgi:hypothetical protein
MASNEPVLVEVNPGEFAVFGGLHLDGVTIQPAPLLPATARRSFENQIATAAAAGNLGLQIGSTLGAFEGLVRLSPATLETLKAGATPMSNGAFNLGSLVDSSGHIVHSVQWITAGATGVAAGVAAVGPALAMMAIQMQLAKITRLAEENLRLSDAILEELRTEHWAEVEGYHSAMIDMIKEARGIGEVNSNIWQNVSGNEGHLQKVRAHFRRKVERHLSELRASSNPVEVREFLDHHGDAILADVQGLLQAQAAWFTYQAIRAGHIYATINGNPTNAEHLELVVSNAQERHEQDLRDSAQLIDALLRRASAIVAAKDSGLIPFGKKRRSAKAVAHAGETLRKLLVELHANWNLGDPPIPSPEIAASKWGVSNTVLNTFRWHLAPSERMLALANAQDQSSGRSVWEWNLQDAHLWIAVTNERILIAKDKDLVASGEIVGAIPVDAVRYVRYRAGEPKKVNARLDIVTKDRDLNLRFGGWGGQPDSREHVDRFAQHVTSLMSLPKEEVPASPIAEPEEPGVEGAHPEDLRQGPT